MRRYLMLIGLLFLLFIINLDCREKIKTELDELPLFVTIQCPNCGGKDCPNCGGTGYQTLEPKVGLQ